VSNLDFKTLSSLDLQQLPLEALQSFESAFRTELDRRKVPVNQYHRSRNFLKCFGRSKINNHVIKNLNGILAEDWSYLFTGRSDPLYCVYVHFDPSDDRKDHVHFEQKPLKMHIPGKPFFVGTGFYSQAYDITKDNDHGEQLRELAKTYKQHEFIHVIANKLTEPQALELESKLIFFFGTKNESTRKGILRNLVIPARPL
jgi:hypothetical protein